MSSKGQRCCKVSDGIVGLCLHCLCIQCVQIPRKKRVFLAASFAASIWESAIQAVSSLALVTNNEDSSFGTYLTKIEAAAGAEGESRILFPPDVWAAAPPRGNIIILIPEVTRQFNRRPICGGNRRYFSITSALIRQLFNKRCKAD